MMKIDKFMESVVEITQQRDQDSLVSCLVNALAECIENSSVSFYRIQSALETDTESHVYSIVSSQNDTNLTDSTHKPEAVVAEVNQSQSENRIIEDKDSTGYRLYYPVSNKDRVMAVIEVVSPEITDSDKKLLRGMVKVYENFVDVINTSTHDTLTGLLNRRTFETSVNKMISAYYKKLEEEFLDHPERRNFDESSPHWLGVLDIDHFKNVNDTYGHIYGDEVLLLISQIMKGFFRKSDLIYRFGGEEFVIVLRPTKEKDAVNVFERLRERVAEYNFPQVGKVTVSIGFAQIKQNDYPITILDLADKALYYAKENGRNSIACYEKLISEGQLELEREENDIELF